MTDFSHLNDRARGSANRPDKDRIADILTDRYVPTVEGDEILEDWENLFTEAQIRRERGMVQTRPEGRRLSAETGVGKTTLVKTFAERHKHRRDDDADVKEVVILEVDKPGETPFLNTFLSKFDPKGYLVGSIEYKKKRVPEYIEGSKVTMMFLDEGQNMLDGTQTQLEQTWDMLKSTIANKFGIPIVIVGTERLETTLAHNPQLENRFKRLYELHKIMNLESLQNFLRVYERDIPLRKASKLDGAEKSQYIYDKSDGRMSEIVLCIRRCAIWAIKDKKESITMDHLKRYRFAA